MADTTTPAVQETATETTETNPAPVPPWERDGVDFNPETAWNLIQNLRADNSALRAEKAKIVEELAAQPAPETAPEPRRDYAAELTAAQVENAKLRALAAAGLSLDLANIVAGTTADEVQANIATLRDSIGAGSASREVPPNPAQASEPAPSNGAMSWLDAVRGNRR